MMAKRDRAYYVLFATVPFIAGAWVTFTFLVAPVTGETIARVTFTGGCAALVVAVVSTYIALDRTARIELLWAAVAVGLLMGAIAASVGREGDDLAGFGTFIGAVGVVLAIFKYLDDRRDSELREVEAARLRRNERIRTEWIAFVSNPKLVPAIYMLESNHDDLARMGSPMPFSEYEAWKNGVDQVLEFLLRLAYEVRSGELEPLAVREAAGWYFGKVSENEHLNRYCTAHGYAPILDFLKLHPEPPSEIVAPPGDGPTANATPP